MEIKRIILTPSEGKEFAFQLPEGLETTLIHIPIIRTIQIDGSLPFAESLNSITAIVTHPKGFNMDRVICAIQQEINNH